VLEALLDVRVDRETIRPPRWIGTEAAQIVDSTGPALLVLTTRIQAWEGLRGP